MAGKIVQAKGAPEGNPVRLLLQKNEKERRGLAALIGTLSDLTFVWAGSGVSRCLPVLFSALILSVLYLRYLRLCCHLLHDHFQRGNEVDFSAVSIFC